MICVKPNYMLDKEVVTCLEALTMFWLSLEGNTCHYVLENTECVYFCG